MNPTSFHPQMALFRNLCVNLRDFWCGVLQYAYAQSLDLTHPHFCGIALTGSLTAVQFPYSAELSLTLRKPGTRPEGVGLSPGTGRRK